MNFWTAILGSWLQVFPMKELDCAMKPKPVVICEREYLSSKISNRSRLSN